MPLPEGRNRPHFRVRPHPTPEQATRTTIETQDAADDATAEPTDVVAREFGDEPVATADGDDGMEHNPPTPADDARTQRRLLRAQRLHEN